MNILIIRLTSIGDILLTTPVARALKEAGPTTRISYLVHEGFEELLINNPYCDEIILIRSHLFSKIIHKETRYETLRHLTSTVKKLRDRHFDAVFDLHCVGKTAVLSFLSRSRVRICSRPNRFSFFYTHIKNIKQNLHIIDEQLSCLRYLYPRSERSSATLSIHTDEQDRVRAQSLLQVGSERLRVGIVPFTSHPLKDWGVDNFAHVGRMLISKQEAHIFLIGEEKRRSDASVLAERIGSGVTNLCGNTSIKELVEVIRRLDLLITGDTFPMHIAVLTGTPTVSLFLSHLVGKWAPYSGSHAVLVERGGGIGSIPVADVEKAVSDMIQSIRIHRDI